MAMTTQNAVLDFVLLVALNIPIWSVVEWWVHRTVMHRRVLPRFAYGLRYFDDAYTNHAVLHHQTHYNVYDYEPDDHGRELNLRFYLSDVLSANLLLGPLHALYLVVNPLGSLVLVTIIVAYGFAWNTLHAEMHIPTNRWYFRQPLFRFLNRHHFMHHMHPDRNFNVVLPLSDYLLGTVARPTPEEREAMRAYGLYGNQRGVRARASVLVDASANPDGSTLIPAPTGTLGS